MDPKWMLGGAWEPFFFRCVQMTPNSDIKILIRPLFGLLAGTLKNQRAAKNGPENNIRTLFGAKVWPRTTQKLIFGRGRKSAAKSTTKMVQRKPLEHSRISFLRWTLVKKYKGASFKKH